jgi:cardiolipin synthase
MKAFPIRWCRFVEILSRMLHRNHRKLCLIDQKTAYLGSMNISDTHLDFSDRSGSRDTGVRLTGTPLESLQHAFDRSWCPLGLGTPDHASSNEAVVAADSVFQKRQVYRLLLEEISRAEKRVWFTTAYFAPTLAFMAELKRAALRGVDVVILTTSESDAPVVKWFRTVCYSQLLKSGVQIYEYLPAVLHAKTSLIDDHARVGSSNLNYRSFFSDREVDVTLTHSESLAQLSQQFIRDLEQSKRMNPADWTSRALGDRCLGRLARLFRHWL